MQTLGVRSRAETYLVFLKTILLVLSLKSSAGCVQEPAADAKFSNCYTFNAVVQ